MTDLIILESSLRIMSEAFDRFIGSCMDQSGEPKTPDRVALMKARAYLPPYCRNAYAPKAKGLSK